MTTEPLLEGVPLSTIFDKAQILYDGSFDEDGPKAGTSMTECLSLLQECSQRVRQLSVFSLNEELDDVPTSSLKYLLVPYMTADVMHRKPVLQWNGLSQGIKGQGQEDGSDPRTPYHVPSPDEMAESRLKTLGAVLRALEEFLGSCDRLQLVSKEEKINLQGSLDSSAPLDAATKRNVKVARFKREKELKQRLEMLKARRDAAKRLSLRKGTEARGRLVESQSSGPSNGAETGDDEDFLEDSFINEAEERKLWVTELQSAWLKAVDLEQTVKREEDMLGSARRASQGSGLSSVAEAPLTREQLNRSLQEREASHRRAAAAAAAELQSGIIRVNPAAITCATLAQDVIEGRAGPQHVATHKHTPMPFSFGPVSLLNNANGVLNGNMGNLSGLSARQLAASRVFQPSHSLPSMSIEEAGEREMKMMEDFKGQVAREMQDQGFAEVKEKGSAVGLGDGPPDEEESEDEDEKESDAAVMKARAWDDWKDENPRGKGNSKLTPCG